MTDTITDFDFNAGMVDGGYDPLEDIVTEEEKEQDPGEFTGAPIQSLTAATEQEKQERAQDMRPARERIDELFTKFNPRRRVLAGILRYVDTPQTAENLQAKVEELQTYDFSVYTAANYGTLLEEAGAMVKTDENGVLFSESPEQQPKVVEIGGATFLKPAPWREVYWCATDDAREYLSADDPMARFQELLIRDAYYFDIYERILKACAEEGGAKTPILNALVDNDPLVQNPRYYTAHFTELLERCEALRWQGNWVTTEIGAALLNGEIEVPSYVCVSSETSTEE